MAWLGTLSVSLLALGICWWLMLYVSLFVFNRPLSDFLNWYLCYFFVYFYLGYFRTLLKPDHYAYFAAFAPRISWEMYELSVRFITIYLVIVSGVYLLFSKPAVMTKPTSAPNDGLIKLTYWVLCLLQAWVLLLGYLRMGSNLSGNVFLNLAGQLFGITPFLSLYLFFASRSRWRFIYPLADSILLILKASKGAALMVAVRYLTYFLIGKGYSVRKPPPPRLLVSVALVGVILLWVTLRVLYPLVGFYRLTGDFLLSVKTLYDGPRVASLEDFLDRVNAADNFTLLLQRVLEDGEPYVPYRNTINIVNYLLPRQLFPEKPAYTITNFYTTEIAGYQGDYSFAVMVTDIGEAFYHFGVWGILLAPLLLGLVYSLGSRAAAITGGHVGITYYVLLISSLADPAGMFIEYKFYSFLIRYLLLRTLFGVATRLNSIGRLSTARGCPGRIALAPTMSMAPGVFKVRTQ